jgi:hypothetical protein
LKIFLGDLGYRESLEKVHPRKVEIVKNSRNPRPNMLLGDKQATEIADSKQLK